MGKLFYFKKNMINLLKWCKEDIIIKVRLI